MEEVAVSALPLAFPPPHRLFGRARPRGSALLLIALLTANLWLASCSPSPEGGNPHQPEASPTWTPAAVASPSIAVSPTSVVTTPQPAVVASPTSTPRSQFDYQPIAIIIDNHPDSRPQSGLSMADVVYEALVEWGITRYMAIYANWESPVVGPVRSARHYFVYWANEYDAIFAHAGGSPQGYEAIESLGISHLDDTQGTGSFWRTSDRAAPYNLYTGTEDLRTTAQDSGRGQLGGLRFKDDSPVPPQATTIRLIYNQDYRVGYIYDKDCNCYFRYVQRIEDVDAYTGAQYHPKNIIVQLVDSWPVEGDEKGRIDMAFVGSGLAYVFVDGQVIKGTWSKPALDAATRFVDDQGQDILLNRGQTWIQVAPADAYLEYE